MRRHTLVSVGFSLIAIIVVLSTAMVYLDANAPPSLANPVKQKRGLSENPFVSRLMVPSYLTKWHHAFEGLVSKRFNEFLLPRTDLPDSLSCEVSCVARRDGRVLNVRVEKRSGNSEFDSLASASLDSVNDNIPKFSKNERLLISGKCIKSGRSAVFKTDRILPEKSYFNELGSEGYKRFGEGREQEINSVGDFWPTRRIR